MAMRIVTWNVNGLKRLLTVRQKSLRALLDELNADIVCFQETKLQPSQLDEAIVNVGGYEGFFSFSRTKKGYSGVATYCRSNALPLAAEEGFSGHLTKSPSHINEVHRHNIAAEGEVETMFSEQKLEALDVEGRCLITHHGSFVLLNVYLPAIYASVATYRHQFKAELCALVKSRCESLVAKGHPLIVVGDINTAHRMMDHCDPRGSMREYHVTDFNDTPQRRWLTSFLQEGGGHFIDVFRYFHPSELRAYTVWTSEEKRQRNYGTRVDYILATKEFFERGDIINCEIHPRIVGSDHCPVSISMKNIAISQSEYLPCLAGKHILSKRRSPQTSVRNYLLKQIHSERTKPAAFISLSNGPISPIQNDCVCTQQAQGDVIMEDSQETVMVSTGTYNYHKDIQPIESTHARSESVATPSVSGRLTSDRPKKRFRSTDNVDNNNSMDVIVID
eukprot:GILK01012994.1.p1 GENE.GILK01012994.1~~GILK01012994.1.p1  ORF type:complete len:460 (+),score=50.17 GILK01012994.1:38-1381(+)